MASLAGFDANHVEPNVGFDTIPAGDYDAVIVSSAMEATKDKKGQFLKLELQILSGQFQNRKLFDRLNIVNANATAVKIAKGTLSAICRAVNVLTPQDSSELHNKPLTISVRVKRGEGKYEDSNEIKAYKPRASTAIPQQVSPTSPSGPVPDTASPWK